MQQGRLSQNSPSEKTEQFGRPAYFDVEKELNAVHIGWREGDKSVVRGPGKDDDMSHQAKRL